MSEGVKKNFNRLEEYSRKERKAEFSAWPAKDDQTLS